MQIPLVKFLAIGGISFAMFPMAMAYLGSTPISNTALPNSSTVTKLAKTAPTIPVLPDQSTQHAMVVVPPDQKGNFVVVASINGTQVPMFFDTGATVVALSFEDATKAGVRLTTNDFRTRIETANGSVAAAEIMLRDMRIDGIVLRNVSAIVLPAGKLKTSLLGRSFWGRLGTGFAYAGGNLILKD